jgi:peptidoglycan/LPS O-acetylase OafA/YrhL
MPKTRNELTKRVPGLDGLRGISIILVLCAHFARTPDFYSPALWNPISALGNLGVRIFFVISGYIITLLLLREAEKTGKISVGQFYLRRVLRIFPASYAFILFITIVYAFGPLRLKPGDLLHAYTYTINYFPGRSWWVGHLWSLSVEEQFYLLWPATLLFLGIQRGLKAAVVVILLEPFIRVGTFYFSDAWRFSIVNSFQTVSDAIATGCILAGYQEKLLLQGWFRKIIDSRAFFLVPLAALALNTVGEGILRWAVLLTLINIAIALCICRAALYANDLAGRVLNSAPLVFIGTLSYSLYLWQQLFLEPGSPHSRLERFPQNLILACCAALLSYYGIERPFLALRDKVRARQTSETTTIKSNLAEQIG